LRASQLDDYAIASWRNAIRFVRQPASRQVVLRPTPYANATDAIDPAWARPRAVRFGCPCAVGHGPHGLLHSVGNEQLASSSLSSRGTRLWHTDVTEVSTTISRGRRRPPLLDEHAIVSRW
jgi:hypothetical protein